MAGTHHMVRNTPAIPTTHPSLPQPLALTPRPYTLP
jgi:hypothetical protein